MSDEQQGGITTVLKEDRSFPPPQEFQTRASVKSMEEYEQLWQKSIDDSETFWTEQAETLLDWDQRWETLLEWNAPFAKWFVGGKLNACHNCVDRHLLTWRKNKAAIVWEGEPGDSRVLTFSDLHREVCKFSNALKSIGVTKGQRVTIYMPMIPELAIAVLACARIGAPHSVVFGGFSSEALADRNNDAEASVMITADGGWRRGKIIPLKDNVDECLTKSPTVKNVIVYKRTGQEISMESGRDHWWHELVEEQSADCPAEPMDSEDPLFLLYTSGSTGKPKGILHTTAGYLLGATLTTRYIFDLKEEDTYWCTADVGWITGHSYIVYGPLSNGATTVMYEGAPNWPDAGRFWDVIEKYRVNILYTAPTAIRAFIKSGDQWPKKHDLTSLRLLGTVGEPINPEAWMWYHEVIGGGRCPIVDTWWQTETGSIMISPLPGATPTVPGCATRPFFGIQPQIVDKEGKEVTQGRGGFLVMAKPWPSMLRNIWGDEERFKQTYWSQVAGKYFTGDGARRDEKGYFWILGRVDDVINVSGHRLSTMEVESALVSHDDVAEAAVVGRPHEVKGEAITCFVTLEEGKQPSPELKTELSKHVVDQIGALARPEEIRFTDSLPKTRSGKIMRRLLRDVAAGRESQGDTSTLEDFTVLAQLRDGDE
ncbi:Acetyl-coenzyme A ligase [Planctomycetes bacterium Pan216]|uniref:Acetyl-coenzyme A synthetase n=1 Tax=Kolteria novifilia TaxID=2527975 RepID=A0A518AYS9_9BACT|nr:Acetyl-coenzyme A ligase [Planctomycetes bacterium Pan216]